MKYNITFRDENNNIHEYTNKTVHEWRFIRAMCDENGWEILVSEPVKKV